MSKYVFIFLGTICVITLAAIAVLGLVNFDIPGAVIEISRTLAASFISAHYFMKDHARLPTRREMVLFVLGGYVSLILISIIGFMILYFVFPEFAEIFSSVLNQGFSQLAMFFVIYCIAYFLIVGAIMIWSFRMYCKTKLKEIERKNSLMPEQKG